MHKLNAISNLMEPGQQTLYCDLDFCFSKQMLDRKDCPRRFMIAVSWAHLYNAHPCQLLALLSVSYHACGCDTYDAQQDRHPNTQPQAQLASKRSLLHLVMLQHLMQ